MFIFSENKRVFLNNSDVSVATVIKSHNFAIKLRHTENHSVILKTFSRPSYCFLEFIILYKLYSLVQHLQVRHRLFSFGGLLMLWILYLWWAKYRENFRIYISYHLFLRVGNKKRGSALTWSANSVVRNACNILVGKTEDIDLQVSLKIDVWMLIS